MLIGCSVIVLYLAAIFILPAVFFNTGISLPQELELDLLISVIIGFIGTGVLGFASDEKLCQLKLPIFSVSVLTMLMVYSLMGMLIIGFTDIDSFLAQQLAKKILIYIIYLFIAIILDVLKSKGYIKGPQTMK